MTLILTVAAGGTDAGPESPYRMEGDMIVIGRSRNCDWHLPDSTNAISSRHCEIRQQGDSFVLSDISTNGTFLNDAAERMAGEHQLVEGDRLRVGPYEIVASLNEVEEEKTIFMATPDLAPAAAEPVPVAEPESSNPVAAEPVPEMPATQEPTPELAPEPSNPIAAEPVPDRSTYEPFLVTVPALVVTVYPCGAVSGLTKIRVGAVMPGSEVKDIVNRPVLVS